MSKKKDLQTRMLEAGIVPKEAVGQMEQWHMVPEGSAQKVGTADVEKVKALKTDLELQQLPVLKETLLDIKQIMKRTRFVVIRQMGLEVGGLPAGVDRLGRYIFAIPRQEAARNRMSALLRLGTLLRDPLMPPPRDERRIVTVSVLYGTVEQQDKKVSLPTHWFCETIALGEESIVRGR